MSEQPPEGTTVEQFQEAVRQATLQGMKDYDREREEWETAIAAQEKARKESEDDNPPKGQGSLIDKLFGG